MSEAKKSMGIGKMAGIGCLGVLGIFVLLAVIGAIVGDAGKDKSGSASVAVASDGAESMQVSAAAEGDAPAEAPESNLTGPQANAARSATQYINMSGFSRAGLIDQLSSDAGNGYDVADATAAVDSLNIDWNEQAARSAKQYLDMSGFSCKGLIEQLSSDAGSKYTKSQATHGAQQAGAC